MGQPIIVTLLVMKRRWMSGKAKAVQSAAISSAALCRYGALTGISLIWTGQLTRADTGAPPCGASGAAADGCGGRAMALAMRPGQPPVKGG
ncbi:MAG: hypothetical protein BWX70_02967 [Verrucomicrobia bacterium ADurb.Bin070]|nr:MAG: hypothetical protein BWX70_02967 [Verrucomicrobia bacterium ADurb.Bin070]